MGESIEIIDCNYLFNLLNSEFKYPCLSDPHFLLLIDARSFAHYNESHIITAKTIRRFGEDFLLCEEFEVENRTHIVIYDHDFNEERPNPTTIRCSNIIWLSGARFPIKILKGGYILFSSIYPFLRTRKVLYMPKELDNFETYPSEIIPGFLYLGRSLHAEKPSIQKDLKITRHVNCSDCPSKLYPNISKNILTLNIPYVVDSSVYFRFQTVCDFIDFNYDKPKGVLIYSKYGVNSNAAIAIVYYLYLNNVTYEEAYSRIKECCPKVHLSRKMEELLRKWEVDVEKNPFSHRNRTSVYETEYVKSKNTLVDSRGISQLTKDESILEDVLLPKTSNSDELAAFRLNDISSLYFNKIVEKNKGSKDKFSDSDIRYLETYEDDVKEEENDENKEDQEKVEIIDDDKKIEILNDIIKTNVEKTEDEGVEANDGKKLDQQIIKQEDKNDDQKQIREEEKEEVEEVEREEDEEEEEDLEKEEVEIEEEVEKEEVEEEEVEIEEEENELIEQIEKIITEEN